MCFLDIWRQKRIRTGRYGFANSAPPAGYPSRKPKTKKPRENQKTKTFQRMFGLRLMFVFFWFSSSFLFFFGHDLEKTKKTQGFFGFLEELLLEVNPKTKKTQVFFGFLDRFLEDMSKQSMQKTKKDLSFFGFSQVFNHQFIQKTKKP